MIKHVLKSCKFNKPKYTLNVDRGMKTFYSCGLNEELV